MACQETRRSVGWAEGRQDARIVRDVNDFAGRHDDEPQACNRAEPRGHPGGTVALQCKQAEQDQQAQRQNVGREGGGDEIFCPSTAESTEIAGVMMASP